MKKSRLFIFVALPLLFLSCSGEQSGNSEPLREAKQKALEQDAGFNLAFRDTLARLHVQVIDSVNRLISLSGRLGKQQLGLSDTDIRLVQVKQQLENVRQLIARNQQKISAMVNHDANNALKKAGTTFNQSVLKVLNNDFTRFMMLLEKGLSENDGERLLETLDNIMKNLDSSQARFDSVLIDYDRRHLTVSENAAVRGSR